MRYWETNFDKWARLNPNYVAGRGRGGGWFKGTLQKMVKSDMYGFMIGGAVGATAGLITTGGVASGPMALETGLTFACNGSAVAGIRALLND